MSTIRVWRDGRWYEMRMKVKLPHAEECCRMALLLAKSIHNDCYARREEQTEMNLVVSNGFASFWFMLLTENRTQSHTNRTTHTHLQTVHTAHITTTQHNQEACMKTTHNQQGGIGRSLQGSVEVRSRGLLIFYICDVHLSNSLALEIANYSKYLSNRNLQF